MVLATLALAGLVKLASCVSFLLVGASLRARSVASEYARVASRAFVAWWWGMAGFMLFQGALEILAAYKIADLAEMTVVRLVEIPLIATAAWGIMTYVTMLLEEKPRGPLYAGVYAILAGAAYAAETLLEPQVVNVGDWSAGIGPAGSTLAFTLVYALFGVPLILATIAYATLLFRVREAIQRYRIALVSGSLMAWVVGGLVGTTSGNGLWNFIGVTGLGIIAAGAVLLAYRPPHTILARLAPEDPVSVAKRRADIAKRARNEQRYADLI